MTEFLQGPGMVMGLGMGMGKADDSSDSLSSEVGDIVQPADYMESLAMAHEGLHHCGTAFDCGSPTVPEPVMDLRLSSLAPSDSLASSAANDSSDSLSSEASDIVQPADDMESLAMAHEGLHLVREPESEPESQRAGGEVPAVPLESPSQPESEILCDISQATEDGTVPYFLNRERVAVGLHSDDVVDVEGVMEHLGDKASRGYGSRKRSRFFE